jgi:hypothetical protein
VARLEGRLGAALAEVAAVQVELDVVRSGRADELAALRAEAEARASLLTARVAELEGELERVRASAAEELAKAWAAERDAAGRAAEALAGAEAGRALAEGTLAEAHAAAERAREEVAAARAGAAASSEALALARAASAAADAALAEARGEVVRVGDELVSVRSALFDAQAEVARLEGELAMARAALAEREAELAEAQATVTALRAEVGSERARADAAEAALAAAGAADAAPGAAPGGRGSLLGRIAALEHGATGDLGARAALQAAAAEAAAREAADAATGRAAPADLDAAARALRARFAEPAPAEGEGPAEDERPAEDEAVPRIDVTPPEREAAPEHDATPPEDELATLEAEATPDAEATPAAATAPSPDPRRSAPAAPEPAAPAPGPAEHVWSALTSVDLGPLTTAAAVSSTAVPRLRAALVAVARDDPYAAARMLLGLVPVQATLLREPLDYDLTISGIGTFAVTVTRTSASVRALGAPRPRRDAAFHLSASAPILLEVLAGAERKLGRFHGSLRIRGRRAPAERLRAVLRDARLSLADAVAAGADLDPDATLRTLAAAIDPAWTKGHRFTVVIRLADVDHGAWRIVVADGARVVVTAAHDEPADATVTATEAAFRAQLLGVPAPDGERPAIRGDRTAVEALRGWADRAAGRAGAPPAD